MLQCMLSDTVCGHCGLGHSQSSTDGDGLWLPGAALVTKGCAANCHGPLLSSTAQPDRCSNICVLVTPHRPRTGPTVATQRHTR